MRTAKYLIALLAISSLVAPGAMAEEISIADKKLQLVATINGSIAPKSVLASGHGLVSAHNMMYRHSVTIYDAQSHQLLATVPDSVDLKKFGYSKYSGLYKGAPVEGAFSPDGKYLYFTNYAMYGKGYNKEGHDVCSPASGYDKSFLSRINLSTYEIDAVYPVGSVPKVVKVSPDNKYILVTNWCSYTLTVISVDTQKTVKTIKIGRFPRGIAISSDSKYAYVVEMGGARIHRISLSDWSVSYIPVGTNPRAVVLSSDDSKLYATLNKQGRVIGWDLTANKKIGAVKVGDAARSLDISNDDSALFSVNYKSGTISKIRTSDMKTIETVKACAEPIGISFDPSTSKTWVACYRGQLKVFSNL